MHAINPGSMMPVMPMMPSPYFSPCLECRGRGFKHDSSMNHDKPPDQRCFFCKPCRSCNGRAEVPFNGSRPCMACCARGFIHDSSMNHDKPPDQKCFFCKPCHFCNGSCRV